MTTLREYLIKWNDGILRGAQIELAKKIKTSEATISRWIKGELRPSQRKIRTLAEVFGASVQDIEDAVKSAESNIGIAKSLSDIRSKERKAALDKEIVLVEFTRTEWNVLQSIAGKKTSPRRLPPAEQLRELGRRANAMTRQELEKAVVETERRLREIEETRKTLLENLRRQ